ncbi:MAG: universal stress protein [Nitrospirae bacterium]|nr:universal stress protein [Nitrospirota bacterium]
MYKKILAAVNEFTNSELAAHYAITLSQSCRAKLFLVFIAQEGINKNAFKQAESALERLFVEADGRGTEVESITEKGEPLQKIHSMVKSDHIDIVFTSTRREDVTKRFFVKTLAREFMLKLPCSVAMVRVVRMGKMHPKDILVPLRGEMTHLEERACFVAKLAQGFGSSVTLFHSARPITSFFHGEVHLKPSLRERHIPKDVELFTECLDRYTITHEKRIEYGGISRAITIEAAYRRNDLIIMGASERSLLRSIIRGNPVEEVLRETPCDLIILRPRHEHQ